MRRFTVSEKNEGELSVRDMSDKAQRAYYSTDLLSVVKYDDMYAVNDDGTWYMHLSFADTETYLEEYDDNYNS